MNNGDVGFRLIKSAYSKCATAVISSRQKSGIEIATSGIDVTFQDIVAVKIASVTSY